MVSIKLLLMHNKLWQIPMELLRSQSANVEQVRHSVTGPTGRVQD